MAVRTPLKMGDTGPAVAHLQTWLNAMFAEYSQIDVRPQRYGPQTVAVIAEFQRRAGVGGPDADGRVVGPRTWAALEQHGYALPGEDRPDNVAGVEQPAAKPAQPAKPARAQSVTPTTAGKSDWVRASLEERMRYVMARLVDRYGYPANGAAGIVGNLSCESGVLPNRLEGSKSATPLRAKDFHGSTIDFTPEQVMNRDKAASRGPKLPGIGLAQWTSGGRRAGLFTYIYEGGSGPGVLFDMDAQIDYLSSELQSSYSKIRSVLMATSVSVNDASDEILYNFEIPGAILDAGGKKLPRSDGKVREVFTVRRAASNQALQAYLA